MSYSTFDPPRPLTAEEHDLLSAMLSRDFTGADALREQLRGVTVTRECACGCGQIFLAVDPSITSTYTGLWPGPVSALGYDRTDQPVGFIVVVGSGRLKQLDIIPHNSRPIAGPLDVATLHYNIAERTGVIHRGEPTADEHRA